MAAADRPQRASQPDNPPAAAQVPTDASEAIRDGRLLEQVVAETMAADVREMASAEREALLAVARRHRGQPLDHAPVAPELVLAVLRIRFDRLPMDEAQWHDLATTVATTLLEAPDVRARLISYWERLGQALV